MMQHKEALSTQETQQYHRPRLLFLLVSFHTQLVAVTPVHGVDVVGKVGRGKQDVGVGQPVSENQPEQEVKLMFTSVWIRV